MSRQVARELIREEMAEFLEYVGASDLPNRIAGESTAKRSLKSSILPSSALNRKRVEKYNSAMKAKHIAVICKRAGCWRVAWCHLRELVENEKDTLALIYAACYLAYLYDDKGKLSACVSALQLDAVEDFFAPRISMSRTQACYRFQVRYY